MQPNNKHKQATQTIGNISPLHPFRISIEWKGPCRSLSQFLLYLINRYKNSMCSYHLLFWTKIVNSFTMYTTFYYGIITLKRGRGYFSRTITTTQTSFTQSQLRKLTNLLTRKTMFMFMFKRMNVKLSGVMTATINVQVTYTTRNTIWSKLGLTAVIIHNKVISHCWWLLLDVTIKWKLSGKCRRGYSIIQQIIWREVKNWKTFPHRKTVPISLRVGYRNFGINTKLCIKHKTNHHRRHCMKRFHSHRQITKWKESRIFSLNGI